MVAKQYFFQTAIAALFDISAKESYETLALSKRCYRTDGASVLGLLAEQSKKCRSYQKSLFVSNARPDHWIRALECY